MGNFFGNPVNFDVLLIFTSRENSEEDNEAEGVKEALNKKIEATQRAQQRENELRESEAQAKKEMALADGIGRSKVITARAEAESLIIEAKAKAEANNMLAKSLTPDLLKWQSISKWNGQLPKALGGDATSFLIDLKSEHK